MGQANGLRNCLETARRKWCNDHNTNEANRRLVNEATLGKLLKSEERRKAFETRWNEVKAKNLQALDEGTFEGPIVPIGYAPREPREVRAAQNEDNVDDVSFLQDLYEPPEGVTAPTYNRIDVELPPPPCTAS